MPTDHPRPLTARGLVRFLPPVLWMGVIALGSSSLLSGDRTGGWMLTPLGHLAPWASPTTLAALHFGLRKLGHVVEYGVLAVLWHRALAPAPRALTAAVLLAAGYGALDELGQGLTASRTAAVSDVAIDAAGALLGVAAWTEPGPLTAATLRGAAWITGLLAGLAAVGVAIDATLGRPAVDLGATAVGLGLVAGGLARLARRTRIRVSSGPQAPAPP
jgi:hypothetical protein